MFLQSQAELSGARLEVCGSFKLGVSSDSDIDLVFVVPRHITRKDFNKNFINLLQTIPETTSVRVRWNFFFVKSDFQKF